MKKRKILFLLLSLILSAGMIGCTPSEKPPATTSEKPSEEQATMVISGKITLFAKDEAAGEPASNVNVTLYTVKEAPLAWQPPIGDEIASVSTDEKGNYELKVSVGKYAKVIVYVDASPQGWQEIEVVKGEKTVDLVKGFPAPMAPPAVPPTQ